MFAQFIYFFLCSYIFELFRYYFNMNYAKKGVHMKIIDVAAYQKHATILAINLLVKRKKPNLVNFAQFSIFFSL